MEFGLHNMSILTLNQTVLTLIYAVLTLIQISGNQGYNGGNVMRKTALFLVFSLFILMLPALVFGGGGSQSKDPAAGSTAQQSAAGPAAKPGDIKYPIPGNVKLSYWIPMVVSNHLKSLAENLAYIEMQKKTGVTIDFIHPPVNDEQTNFNLMIASRDLPDIIQRGEMLAAGIDYAIEDKLYIRLNDLASRYAPDYLVLINSDPELKRQVYSDMGNLLGFGMLTVDAPGTDMKLVAESCYDGPCVRKDWLDQLGLPIPKTIPEWDTMLRGFKSLGIQIPLLMWESPRGFDTATGTFLTAYGIGPEFYVEGGKIKYGPIEPGFRAYLEQMRIWYADGLMDKDFPARKRADAEALIADTKNMSVGSITRVSTAIPLMAQNLGLELVGVPFPTLDANSKTHWRRLSPLCRNQYGVVTTACKNPEAAVMFLNYSYTEEAMWMTNIGPKDAGVYTSVNNLGQPAYVEPYGSKWDEYNTYFMLRNGNYVKSDYRANPRRWNDKLENYRRVWDSADASFVLPPFSLTQDEGRASASIMVDIETYRDQMVIRFITGDAPMSDWDSYVARIKSLNIQRAIDIRQAANDRYLSKKVE